MNDNQNSEFKLKQELDIKSQLKITRILKNYTNTIREEEKKNWWIDDEMIYKSLLKPLFILLLIPNYKDCPNKNQIFYLPNNTHIPIFTQNPNFPFHFQFVAAEKRKARSWEARRLQLGFSSGSGSSLFFFLLISSSSFILAQSIRFSSQHYFLQKSNNKQIKFKNNLDYEQKLSD